jgi:intracellular sulfur oxidation DsrE/DsrF family protein
VQRGQKDNPRVTSSQDRNKWVDQSSSRLGRKKQTEEDFMLVKRWKVVLCAAFFFTSFVAISSVKKAAAQDAQALHIDVPVKLEKANVVFDVGQLVFGPGDMPFLLGDLNLLAGDYRQWGTKGEIVAVFHGDAAYLVLNDTAYNADRHVKSGNPYAELIAGLMNQGVQIELCGATAAANHWVNSDLLPGVKVNTNAMVRVTQLEEEGYTLIYE